MNVRIASAVCLWLLTGSAGLASAQAAESNVEGIAYFERHVRPLFAKHCTKCHAADSDEANGSLLLDSRAGWMAGGDSGRAVVPGSPDESLLIRAIGYADSDLQMPPRGKLSPAEIAVLVRWVKIGAPDPRLTAAKLTARAEIDIEAGRKFWAFQPPHAPQVPDVGDDAWPRTSLDRFVLAGLEARGITPALEADRRTLIRRATFDLIGLPPTGEEIAAFLADDSPDAFARVVDRLLESPHYGERWGRHWLDVARYADSNGMDENVAHGNAWRYRDYVVSSLNRDKPYDVFLTEQLAGDLLPGDGDIEQRHQRLIATGFLSLGPKVLAEVDERKMEMDIVDEQIATVSRVFLGLSMECARCHDHKFDPLPTEDYYALAGIFKSTRTMEHFTKIARWYENPLVTGEFTSLEAAYQKQLENKQAQIQSVLDAENKRLAAATGENVKPAENPESQFGDDAQAELKRLREELAALEKEKPEPPSAMGVTEGEIADTSVHYRGSHLTLGDKVPRRFPLVLTRDDPPELGTSHSGRLQLARWLTDPHHPLTARVMVNRIWHWHFGEGLVRTPDNFGAMGDRPANQALLDHLARAFIESDWSIKALHRQIMLSSTYRMSSAFDAKAAKIDPENRLHWRMDIRRLEGEVIRDALLATSGMLDRTMGGSLLKLKNREFVFNHTSKDNTRYESRRRSLYLPVIRNHLYDVLALFDYPDPAVPTGHRNTTTIAPQALFMMNSPLVQETTAHLASELLADASLDDSGRLQQIYIRAYGRPPTEAETTRNRAFLQRIETGLATDVADSAQRRKQVWQALCHVVVSSNEFVYIQ